MACGIVFVFADQKKECFSCADTLLLFFLLFFVMSNNHHATNGNGCGENDDRHPDFQNFFAAGRQLPDLPVEQLIL